MKTLEFGAFHGCTARQLDAPHVALLESVYAEGLILPRHGHVDASFCLTLSGTWYDNQDGNHRQCSPQEVLYRPKGVVHDQRYARETRCLNLDLSAGWLDGDNECSLPRSFARFDARSESARILGRLRRELWSPDSVSDLAVEGLCLELLVECSRAADRTNDRGAPAWLRTAEEFVRAHALEPLRVSQVASVVGIHPAHLTRAFRRHLRYTVAGYVRRLRVQRASELLEMTDRSVAEIAQDVGFCDQSHLTRHFRSQLGLSPGAFRASLGGRSLRPQTLGSFKTGSA